MNVENLGQPVPSHFHPIDYGMPQLISLYYPFYHPLIDSILEGLFLPGALPFAKDIPQLSTHSMP